jgi:hypothetical protein
MLKRLLSVCLSPLGKGAKLCLCPFRGRLCHHTKSRIAQLYAAFPHHVVAGHVLLGSARPEGRLVPIPFGAADADFREPPPLGISVHLRLSRNYH